MKGHWGEDGGLRYVQIDPDGSEVDLPLIVAIHGRGANATDLAGLASDLEPERVRWVLPQGPRPVEIGPGYIGWAWYELGSGQPETVVESREILLAFIDHTLDRLAVARDRALLAGFSQGGAMTLHAGLSAPAPLAGLAVMSGHLPAPETISELLPRRRDRSVLMVHGTHDQVLPIDRARHARDALLAAGLAPEYHELPMDHEITAQSLDLVRDYVRRSLKLAAV